MRVKNYLEDTGGSFFNVSLIVSLMVSYNVKTNAPPVPLRIFENAPLKKAGTPSALNVFIQQSNVLLYIISCLLSPDCIIIRLLTVSKGYDTIPATVVTACKRYVCKYTINFKYQISNNLPEQLER